MTDQGFSTFVMSETTLNQIRALPPETQSATTGIAGGLRKPP